ncbi:MAG: hypothetical protein ACOH2M_22545 [Cypionkella sp.]
MKENDMFKSILTPALIALSLASVANAGEVSTDAQLAASAGVASNEYTAAELQNIVSARRDNNQTVVNFYVSHANRNQTQGDAGNQLAKLAGVAPGTYSASELQLIINAQAKNDTQDISAILTGANRADVDGVGVVTPGKAQLAASLGLNPADYTLAQLAALDFAKTSSMN